MLYKNDETVIDITGYTADGSGIGKCDGMAIFVPLAAKGDRAKVKVLKVKKTYAYGKLIEIITPSKDRISNDCPAFQRCGGCVSRNISYTAELSEKSNRVYETVKRIGGIDLKPEPIIYGADMRYRNKAQYPLDSLGNAGFYSFHSHRVIPCGDCLLQPEIFGRLVSVTKEWIKRYNIEIYSETENKGLLRHIYIRQAAKTKEIMFTAVINSKTLLFADELIELLKQQAGENLKSVQLNINTYDTNVILGDECVCIYGEPYIFDILCGVKVRLSPLSFYQVNSAVAEKLYEKAAEYAQVQGKNVIDLYCGAGTIGLSLAQNAKSVIGVEIIPEAVKDAEFNAKENGIANARFICADAKAAAKKLAKENISADVIIVDPPRKGCDSELIDTIANDFKPERVVYVSCDPATLSRDIKLFAEKGYKLKEYTPVDMFPRTSHCEVVCKLLRSDMNS